MLNNIILIAGVLCGLLLFADTEKENKGIYGLIIVIAIAVFLKPNMFKDFGDEFNRLNSVDMVTPDSVKEQHPEYYNNSKKELSHESKPSRVILVDNKNKDSNTEINDKKEISFHEEVEQEGIVTDELPSIVKESKNYEDNKLPDDNSGDGGLYYPKRINSSGNEYSSTKWYYLLNHKRLPSGVNTVKCLYENYSNNTPIEIIVTNLEEDKLKISSKLLGSNNVIAVLEVNKEEFTIRDIEELVIATVNASATK